MNTTEHLPAAISHYIRSHFHEDFLFDVKKIFEKGGFKHYEVEVSKDNYIHKLTFDEHGQVLNEQTDQAFPSDQRGGLGFGETPE